MHIEGTDSGRYKVRWRDHRTGKNQSKTFGLKRDANEFVAALQAAKHQDSLRLEPMWRTMLRSQLDDQAEITEDAINPHGFMVYLLWPISDDKPLYVGRSANVLTRLGQHMADPAKAERIARITLVRCYSRAVMEKLELKLIRFYAPEMNISDNIGGWCKVCGEARCVGRAIYCSPVCAKQARTEARAGQRAASRTPPALRDVSAAHRRAVRKLAQP